MMILDDLKTLTNRLANSTAADALPWVARMGAVTAVTGSDVTIASTIYEGAYSNTAATALRSLTLSAATVGKQFIVWRNNPAWPFRVKPDASDRIGNGVNGQYIDLLDDDMVIVLRCLEAGHWTVQYVTGLFTYDTGTTGRTLYIDPAGNDANDGSVGSPRKTLAAGMRLLRPGDTLTVNNGTYAGTDNELSGNAAYTNMKIPKGTRSRPIVIKAATRGGAIFTAPLAVIAPDWKMYLDIDGLIFNGAEQKTISAQYMRFFNCGFRGSRSTGNYETVSIGGGDSRTRGAQQILFEDCWAWGPGGRYRFLAYNTKGVVFRRCVARWDQGWLADGSGLLASDFKIYDSEDSYAQNCISIDSLRPTDNPSAWVASFASESNYWLSRNHRWQGCIAINNQGNLFVSSGLATANVGPPSGTGSDLTIRRAMRLDGLIVEHMAGAKLGSSDNKDGIVISKGRNVQVSNCTIADLNVSGYALKFGPETRFMHGARADNILVALDGTGLAYKDVTPSNSLDYSTLAAAKTAGLTYLPRSEASSTIATGGGGVDGGVGATIMTRIGEYGALAEDPGVETNGSRDAGVQGLWPFPNEDLIKTCFSAAGGFGDADRDWTAGGLTLSQYVWGALGTAGPP